MSSAFGIIEFLFSKNLPLLVGIVALDYLGMYVLNLGEIMESVMFFLMILLALIFSGTVHSAGDLLRLLVIMLVVDLVMRWGLKVILPPELTSITMEKVLQS